MGTGLPCHLHADRVDERKIIMKENEILDEIHRHRAEHARECDYDIHKIFQEIRVGTAKLKSEGWKIGSPEPREVAESAYALREESVKKK